jgi:hypothetical protein
MRLKAQGGETVSSTDTPTSIANAARPAKAKQVATQTLIDRFQKGCRELGTLGWTRDPQSSMKIF